MPTREELIAAIQKVQDRFCLMMGAIAVLVDTKGNFVTQLNMDLVPDACKIIWEKSEKKIAPCMEHLKMLTERVVKEKKIILETCHAGFIEFAIPVIVKGEVLGAMIGCGLLRLIEGESEEELEERYKKLAETYKIEDVDEFVEAVKRLKVTPEEEFKARIDLLDSMLDVTMNYTDIKAVFGIASE